MKAFADHEEETAAFLPSCIVSVYDVVEGGADFDALRYVRDATKPPLAFTCAEFHPRRRQQGFAPVLTWQSQRPRAHAHGFTKHVFA